MRRRYARATQTASRRPLATPRQRHPRRETSSQSQGSPTGDGPATEGDDKRNDTRPPPILGMGSLIDPVGRGELRASCSDRHSRIGRARARKPCQQDRRSDRNDPGPAERRRQARQQGRPHARRRRQGARLVSAHVPHPTCSLRRGAQRRAAGRHQSKEGRAAPGKHRRHEAQGPQRRHGLLKPGSPAEGHRLPLDVDAGRARQELRARAR